MLSTYEINDYNENKALKNRVLIITCDHFSV